MLFRGAFIFFLLLLVHNLDAYLKVVINEKGGGSARWRWLSSGLGL
jgi:hypothetical protein